MRLLLLVLLLTAATSTLAQSDPAEKESNPVDLELVLAADVSFSMDKGKLELRREGYAQAITSPEFLKALKTGPSGKVAITYFEWAASSYQKVIVPWRTIDGPEAAAAVAAEIMAAPNVLQSRTSISGAIHFAMSLFDKSPFRSPRHVIDISGDGPNNNGEPVERARDTALAKGITINGLPMMMGEPRRTQVDIDDLDLYYEDCVTGGPGAFVMTMRNRDELKEAIQTMLVSEISGVVPERRVIPPADREKRTFCMIGEKAYDSIWGQPWGDSLPRKSSDPPSAPRPLKVAGYTPWQQAEYGAYTKKCLLRQKGSTRNRVELYATIGTDGMIVGDPEVTSPIDSEEFRRDVQTALKKLRQCQPFIVNPFRRVQTQFTQAFIFASSKGRNSQKK